jgi:general secretion pathway protein A
LSGKLGIDDRNPATAGEAMLSYQIADKNKNGENEQIELEDSAPAIEAARKTSLDESSPEEKPIEKLQDAQLADLKDFIAGVDPIASRLTALVHLLSLWQQPSPHPNQFPAMVDDASYYQIAALQYGLQLLVVKKDWDLVRRLNLPAVVALAPSPDQPFVYLTLVGVRDLNWVLIDGAVGHTIEVASTDLDGVTTGPVYIFWNNLLATNAIIAHGAPSAAITGLKRLLRLSGFDQIPKNPVFDQVTQQAVVEFQKRNNIQADGLVGPITKILLIHQDDRAQLPKLNQAAVMHP